MDGMAGRMAGLRAGEEAGPPVQAGTPASVVAGGVCSSLPPSGFTLCPSLAMPGAALGALRAE